MTISVSPAAGSWTLGTHTGVQNHTFVLPARPSANALPVVCWLDRSTGLTVDTVSDPTNGAWTIHSNTTDGNGSRTLWATPTSGNAQATVTVHTTGNGNSQISGGWLDSDAQLVAFDAVGTPLVDGAANTDTDSNTVAVSARGCIFGFVYAAVAQTTTPTADGAGESVLVAGAAGFRLFPCFQAVAAAGTHGFELTLVTAAAVTTFHIGAFIDEGGGDPAPSITDINGDDTVQNGSTGNVLTGTNIDDSAATLDFEQGSIVVAQTVTGRTTTSITFTDVEAGLTEDLGFGTTTARVTNGDDQEDTITFDRLPEDGSDYVVITTVSGGTILEFDPALDTDDQVQWRVTDVMFDETDFNVNDDGTFDITEGLATEDVEARRWDATNSTWSDWAAIEIDDGIPDDTIPDAFTFTDQFGTATSATITSASITVAGINAAAAITVSGGTYSINGGSFVSDPGTVSNGDTVRARHTSSASYSTATNTTVTIGGVSDTFTSLTGADPSATGSHSHVASPGRCGGMMGRS